MFIGLASIISVLAAMSSDVGQSVQSKNGEFIFRQYPPRAKAAGEQGTVRFRAEADAKGNVMSCKVIGSSGYRRLDDETCEMIIDHATFKPTLDGDGKPREAVHDGIVNWRLPGAVKAAHPKVAGGYVPDKVLCKRIPKTGSLVTHSRLCMTAREWDRKADDFQEDWGRLQGRYGSTRADAAGGAED
jgi:TonB family protein